MKAIPNDIDVRIRSRKVPLRDEDGEWESVEVTDLVATTPFRTGLSKSQVAVLKSRVARPKNLIGGVKKG